MAVPALVIPALLEAGLKVIDRVFPDPQKKAQAELELYKLHQEGAFKEAEHNLTLAMGQLEVNKIEAASPDNFRAGWRPFIGWVCGVGLAYQFVVRPILGFALLMNDVPTPLPGLELETLITLLFGMLGLGAYRTTEKLKGLS